MERRICADVPKRARSAGVESCAANVSADIFASHAISSILAAHKLGVGVVRGPELQRRAIATSSD